MTGTSDPGRDDQDLQHAAGDQRHLQPGRPTTPASSTAATASAPPAYPAARGRRARW